MSLFISLEGIDGCGKTTQLQMLHTFFKAQGAEVVTTREPGGTALAETMRHYLLHATQAPGARAELLLFGAARAQHVEEIIRPALQRGAVVLSDRFTDSSLAYQGGGLGLDKTFIRQMNDFATGGLQPDLTLLFDVPVEVSAHRRGITGETEDRIEARGGGFLQKVREAFLEIAYATPERSVIIDANTAPEKIHQRVLEAVSPILSDGSP